MIVELTEAVFEPILFKTEQLQQFVKAEQEAARGREQIEGELRAMLIGILAASGADWRDKHLEVNPQNRTITVTDVVHD